MDTERARIQEDLRGLLEGDVRCDDVFVQLYASDASIYEIRPLGVVRPRGVADVVACVQYATEHNLPLHARGAGSGVAGESLGSGLVLDFSHYMRRILEVREDTVRVQPGLILAQLNRQLATHQRLFGPDPATRSVTTVGSVLALDASGSHWPLYGSARGRVVSLQVVLSDGQVIEAKPVALGNPEEVPADRATALARRVADLIERDRATIEKHRPAALVDRSGYHVYDILADGQLDLARLLVGSEGTLGLITEATIKTDPRPLHRGVALLFFNRLESAAQAALAASELGVSACDLMDRRLLTIAREIDVRFDLLIPRDAEAMLLIECNRDDPDELRTGLEELIRRIQHQRRLAYDSRMTLEVEERNLYWRLTRRVVPTLYRLKGSTRALPFVEDVAIPPARLPEFLVQLQNVLKTHQVTATLFAHAGHGKLHVRPFLDLGDPDDVRKMQYLATDLYQHVLDVGGTISASHGEGLSRTWFSQRQHGPLYDVFREVKRIFDPQNILNPGKVVADAPQPLTKNLRPVVSLPPGSAAMEPGAAPHAEEVPPPFDSQLLWQDESMLMTARACNGCGRCRTLSPEERMCPIFRFAPREEASPRAKANLVRAIFTGRLAAEELTRDRLKAIADLCVHCHQCRLECPATVDIPKLVTEAKAQYVATNGLRPTDWLFTRIDLVSALGSQFATAANWMLRNRQMRWLLEKTLGIAQGRKLPRIASRSFLQIAHRRRLTRPDRRSGRGVVYFVDVYANWYDVQLAEALVAILEHNGVTVYVHPAQVQSGMAAMTMGVVETAKKFAARNISALAEAVRQGYHIVTTEPSAALCITHEYPQLVDIDGVRLVAENTSEACTYLWKLHQNGRLELDFKPVHATVGYHEPCHLRALGVGRPGENLLRLIPGLTVHPIDHGCSGMAGTFGLRAKNYRSSLRAGWGMISALRNPELQAGTTECSSCKIQMEQGTTKPTIHPLKLLALSYGLKPEFARLLKARRHDLVVT
jgi:FAD/FMN-containing dehydrogenase/Fe-S oxidoreductase